MIARMLLLLVLGPFLGACVGYTTYEPTAGDRVENQYLSAPAIELVLSESLRFVIQRMPPTLGEEEARLGMLAVGAAEPVPVSLPRGLSEAQHDAIFRRLDGIARPATSDDDTNAVYRVGDIRLRGGLAWVDIHRPIEVPPGETRTPYQCVTVELRNKILSWRPENYQVWRPDTVPLPTVNALTPLPESERAGVVDGGP